MKYPLVPEEGEKTQNQKEKKDQEEKRLLA
jgi:hypothetical protein